MTPAAEVPELDQIQGVLRPSGYRLLVRIPHLEAQMKKFADLHMPDDIRAREEAAQLVAQVIELGPDAYRDEKRFPSGAWCAVGDYILMRAYQGARFTMRAPDGSAVLYALINDDTVQGVVHGDAAEIGRI